MADLGLLASAARDAVLLAARVCRHVQRDLDRVRSITKDDKSPVTVADFASQAVVAHSLTHGLTSGAGSICLVAEEASEFLRDPAHATHLAAAVSAVHTVLPDLSPDDVLAAIDLGAGRPHPNGFWTLDPIDGTKGFLRNQQYAVSLSYIQKGSPVVGALACPNLSIDPAAPVETPDAIGSLYVAVAGQGVLEASGDESAAPRRLRRAGPSAPLRICASVEAAHSSADDTDRILDHLGQAREPVRLDSQAKYAVVARGQADAYLRMPTRKSYVERIWDHAAGSLIATEAGCLVTDIRGHPLDFSHGRGLEANSGIVCAEPTVHARVIEAIRVLGIGAA
ncbi:MAG: 3'(2'),5'-bisphosphate nucleotidase [Phycisphaeraceae bacterium]|nr:3'(2'),5'-bisphosphate nucleotidase [Phycisphaeraceae bacterium]